MRAGGNCGGLKGLDRLALKLSVWPEQVVLWDMALQDLKDVCCLFWSECCVVECISQVLLILSILL